MGLLVTDAIVLHAFDYLETSRIFRLITREAGVQSVLARGVRSSKKRFGGGLDLFSEGEAELQLKPGRDLHTLTRFDARGGGAAFGESLSRFTAASALAECALRVVHDEAAPGVFETVADGLRSIAAARSDEAGAAALGALWSLVAAVGFAPTVDVCANCHAELSVEEDASFSHVAGGVLCSRCASFAPGRKLPAAARAALRQWIAGERVDGVIGNDLRAHQRLFREFLAQHVPDRRPLPAYDFWERGTVAG